MTLGLALPNIPNKAFISARVFHLYREAVSPLPWLPMHIISSGSQGGGDRGWVKEKPERFNLNMNRSSISKRRDHWQGHLLAATMLFKARHNFNEIARSVPDIQLPLQYAVPGVFAGAGRSGQTKNISAV